MKISELGEFRLISRLRSFFPQAAVFRGIGDDCAVVRQGKEYLLYSVDCMVEGSHFEMKAGTEWNDVGWKAVTRSVSDIAAMGGTAQYLLISLMLPSSFRTADFDRLSAGFADASNTYDVSLIGGDITSSPVVSVSITAVGASRKIPLMRSGAKKGDLIYVSGYPGQAMAGFTLLRQGKRKGGKALCDAFLRPSARLELGRLLLGSGCVTSMIDISDGLAGDLSHILEESSVGAEIEKNRLPVSSDMKLSGFDELEIMNFILNGGDDYELLFTVNPSRAGRLKSVSEKTGIVLTNIGTITPKGLFLKEARTRRRLKPASFEHFTAR